MKKLFLIAILLLGVASYAFAENSATGMSGTSFRDQQVFITCYNNSGTAISSNYVVVLDTSTANTASGSTLGTYITTTTTAADSLVIGVTDEDIPDDRAGRVCVRGPHKCYLTAAPSAAGATIATTTTAGAGIPWLAGRPGNNQFGIALHPGVIGVGEDNATSGAVNGGGVIGEGSSNYWIWVGGPTR